jgi:hypothetical protein
MNLKELERTLPNGLHDAMLRKLSLDYVRLELSLDVDLDVSVPEGAGGATRRALISLSHVAFCVITHARGDRPYLETPACIGAHAMEDLQSLPADLPPIPDGHFGYLIEDSFATFSIFLAAIEARLEWLSE